MINRATARPVLAAPDIVSALVAASLIAYVGIRTYALSITIDEALTAQWHVPGSWIDILLLRTPGLEDNNHVLFTLLAKIGVNCFGLSEFSLRLPSLAGFAMFLAAVIALLRQLAPGWTQVFGLGVIALNPYLVDYFSIARGYGLGLGFAATGTALLVLALADSPRSVRPWATRLAFVAFTLGALAHLSFLLVLVAAAVTLWAPFVATGRTRALWRMLWPTSGLAWTVVVVCAIAQGYLLRPLQVIRRQGFFAGDDGSGFWAGTVTSLLDGTLHDATYATWSRVPLLAWVPVTLILASWAVVASSDRRRASSALRVVLALLLLVALGSVLQHQFFGIAMLTGRRGLTMLLLFLLVAVTLPSVVLRPRALRLAALGVGVMLPAALVLHGLLTMNTRYVRDWRLDAAGRDMMLAVKARTIDRNGIGPVRLRVYWPLAPSAEFYRQMLGLTDILHPLSVAERPGYNGAAAFWYVPRTYGTEIEGYGAVEIAAYGTAGTALFGSAAAEPVTTSREAAR